MKLKLYITKFQGGGKHLTRDEYSKVDWKKAIQEIDKKGFNPQYYIPDDNSKLHDGKTGQETLNRIKQLANEAQGDELEFWTTVFEKCVSKALNNDAAKNQSDATPQADDSDGSKDDWNLDELDTKKDPEDIAKNIQSHFKNKSSLLHDGKFGRKSYEEAWKLFRNAKKGTAEYDYWKEVITLYDDERANYYAISLKKATEEAEARDASEFEEFANKDDKDDWKTIPSDKQARDAYFELQLSDFDNQTDRQIQNNFQKTKSSLTDGHFGRDSYKEALRNWSRAADNSKEEAYWKKVLDKYKEKFGGNNYIVKSPDENRYINNWSYISPDRGNYFKDREYFLADYNRENLTKGYGNHSVEDLYKGNILELYRPSSDKVLRVALDYPTTDSGDVEETYKNLHNEGMMLYGTPLIEGNYNGKGGRYIVVPKSDGEGFALLTEAGEYIGDLPKGGFKNGSWRGYNDLGYHFFLDYMDSAPETASFKIGGKLKLNLNL